MRPGALALLGLVACSAPAPPPDDPEPPPADLAVVSGGRLIGPAGGRVSVGPVTLEFPEGALGETVRITVTPVRPGGPTEPGSPPVPTEPAPSATVAVTPADLPLRRAVKISIATEREIASLAVARVGPLPPLLAAWQPLPAQGRSPSLVWAQSPFLGTFGLVPVSCCTDSGVASCSVRCDVGGLRYRCDAESGKAGCCDAYARTPQQGIDALCP